MRTSLLPEELGDLLRQSRMRLGFSQERLSRKLSLSLRTYADWERGKSMPRPQNLQRLVDFLGINPVQLERSTTTAEPDPLLRALRNNYLRTKSARNKRFLVDVSQLVSLYEYPQEVLDGITGMLHTILHKVEP